MDETEAGAIDYKMLYEKVTEELMQARIAILDMRRTKGLFGSVTGDGIRAWTNRNYLVILVGVMLGTFVISSLHTIWELLQQTQGGTNGSRLSE